MALDEIAVMPRDECILQISGMRPFHSKKCDITNYPDYRYLSDYSKRNAFDIDRFLDTRAKLKSRKPATFTRSMQDNRYPILALAPLTCASSAG